MRPSLGTAPLVIPSSLSRWVRAWHRRAYLGGLPTAPLWGRSSVQGMRAQAQSPRGGRGVGDGLGQRQRALPDGLRANLPGRAQAPGPRRQDEARLAVGAGVGLTSASSLSHGGPHPRFSGWEERGVRHPLPPPCRSAGPGPAEAMGGPGSLEQPPRPGDLMKARSPGPSERLEEAGLFRPGKRKAQGAGALANGERQMLTSCSLSPWRPSRPGRTSTAAGS